MSNDLISIAKVLNFHGIKGEAKVGFSKGREKQIEALKKVYIKKENNFSELNVVSVRFHKQFAIIKFKEFKTVNDVEEFKGCDIYLTKEEVENNLDDDEYLISDLIGMDVFDEDGSCVGTITAIGENLANNLLSIKDGNGKEHLVPFVKELVPIVDLKGRKVVLNNIEGLIN
ncbi:TPA: 16S rRNA processing protein RimM [Candidatus Avigastranaerophilus faecigallinarum]|nr:16S rRNA processing protein RimM [Candidatus Avigastranaerophilus faecigallinarum]